MSAPELKPCPFCGSREITLSECEPEYEWRSTVSMSDCRGCGAAGATVDGPAADAAVAWNRRASDNWLPIESAPRDGTRMLVWSAGAASAGRFHGGMWWVEGYPAMGHREPTHWQPLPEDPSDADGEEAGRG